MDRVRVLAVGAEGRCSPAFRIRVTNLGPALSAHDVELEPLPLFTDEQAARFFFARTADRARTLIAARAEQSRRLDAVAAGTRIALIQRQADVLGLRTLERKAISDRRVVYDVDDAIWLESRSEGASWMSALKRSASKCRWLASRADQVIAGNEVLAEHLSRYGSRVAVVPSLVDTASVVVSAPRERPSFELGWIGSPSSARHLRALVPTLERVADELSPMPVSLRVVGAQAPVTRRVKACGIPWTLENERAALNGVDVGLMPLSDEPWTRGKCAYKALVYMAAGLPVAASDVGVSAQVINGAGYVVRTEPEWIDALICLARDVRLRAELGRRGRERVEGEYSLSRWAPELARLLVGS